MQILIFGAQGYVGTAMHARFPDAYTPRVDIADQQAVQRALDEYTPDVVINCAGKTGTPNVDWCEDNKQATLRSNTLGPLVLLEECLSRSIYLVHFSTGCIYDGAETELFTERDAPNFFGSFYSRSKGWSDQILQEFPVLQLRPRMPFDDVPSDRNLLTKLARYSKVLDAPNSMTYLPDMLDVTEKLVANHVTGTFNVVNSGALSPYHVMELYKEIVDPTHTFAPIALDDLPRVTKAARSNCVLSTQKLEEHGIVLPSAEQRVWEALHRYKL